MAAAVLIRPSSPSQPSGRIEQERHRHERAYVEKIISIVTVQAPDRAAAVAVVLAVLSEALPTVSKRHDNASGGDTLCP
jgi:hypothetical protein